MKTNFRKAAAVAAAVIACSVSGAAAVSAAAAGDVNGDGKLNSADIVLFSAYMTGSRSTSFVSGNADMDGDGKINIRDFILAKNAVITGKPADGTETPETNSETSVHLKGSTITSEGDSKPEISGSKVTLTSSGTYYIDGKLDNGQIAVNVPETDKGTVKLVFRGVEITGLSEAPVYIINAEKTSITLEKDTVNIIRDGQNYTETEAAVYAKDDLTIKGEGRLEIYAETYHAVHCSNDLKITGGDICIETGAEDALRGKSSVTVKGGSIFIDSAGDGIKSTKGNTDIEGGTVLIKAKSDAVQAETSVNISGGDITACGGRGLTAAEAVNITGGSVLATATDSQCETAGTISTGAMLIDLEKEWKKNNPVTLTDSSGTAVFDKNTLKKFSYILIADEKLSGSYSLWTGGIKMNHEGSESFRTGSPEKYSSVNNKSDSDVLYADLFDQSKVHSIKIDIPEQEWKILKETAEKEEYHQADITIDGIKLVNVGIRAKGFSSLSAIAGSGGEKFSLRINLDKYEKYQNYKGLTEFCINNLYGDPSGMRDTLCYDAMHALKAPAPKTAYTDVYMNGSLFSFYMLCEVPADTMGERLGTSDDATLYKADQVSCTFQQNQKLSDFSVKYGPDEEMAHITEVVSAINRVTPENYKFIEDIIDVSSFLKGFAVNAYMCNYDSYNGMMAHNYYLLWNEGKMSYVGWDYNLSLGAFMGGAQSVFSDITTALSGADASSRPLVSKLLAVPDYYSEYTSYVKQIAEMYSDPENTVKKIDSLIGSHVKTDPRYLFTAEQYAKNIAKSPEGLQADESKGDGSFGGGFGNWGGGFGGGNFGGWGGGNGGGNFGGWGGGNGGFGGGFGFGNGMGGENVSVTDFMIKRREVVGKALGF